MRLIIFAIAIAILGCGKRPDPEAKQSVDESSPVLLNDETPTPEPNDAFAGPINLNNRWQVTIPSNMHLLSYTTDKSITGRNVLGYELEESPLNPAKICKIPNVSREPLISPSGAVKYYCRKELSQSEFIALNKEYGIPRNSLAFTTPIDALTDDPIVGNDYVGFESLYVNAFDKPFEIEHTKDVFLELCKSVRNIEKFNTELPPGPLTPSKGKPTVTQVCKVRRTLSIGKDHVFWVARMVDDFVYVKQDNCSKPTTELILVAQWESAATAKEFAGIAVKIAYENLKGI